VSSPESDPILAGLNDRQREAVLAVDGPVLILAGPGSGKTRVITHRIAYLIRHYGIPPYQVMAVTFTNKAAREMRDRLDGLIGREVEQVTVGTFHATCARILRRDGEAIGLDRRFVIYDDDDQLKLIKQILANLELDDRAYHPRVIQNRISRAKAELLDPRVLKGRADTHFEDMVGHVYDRYQQALWDNKALDFDDLISTTVQLFRERPEVLERYQRRYQYILVDEFQDTNTAQYALVRTLAAAHRNLCVVGDEDQGIYKWRSADIRNLGNFREDFPEGRLILLEQNYRSTKTILEAAQQVIRGNLGRQEKTLWTENARGVPIVLWESYNEDDEAEKVVREVERLIRQGEISPRNTAVMYRTNAQSRPLEEAFARARIPHRLVGGQRFYERREIKDLIAYLRVLHNPDDNVSLGRIINVPPRRIGAKSLNDLAAWARLQRLTIYQAIALFDPEVGAEVPPPVGAAALKALLEFRRLIEGLRAELEAVNLRDLLDTVLDRSGYAGFIRDGSDEGADRWENVLELRQKTLDFANAPAGIALESFLEEVSLIQDTDTLDADADAVTLITLHAAKGLEFPVVFIVGMEEGVLPHSRSLDEPGELEEERRLAYVGMTRAKHRLYLVHASRRGSYGQGSMPSVASRFLKDIPEHLLDDRRPARPTRALDLEETPVRVLDFPRRATPVRSAATGMAGPRPVISLEAAREARSPERPQSPAPAGEPPAPDGARVYHRIFGTGTVIRSTPARGDFEVIVAFEPPHGVKKLMWGLAPVERVR
jgi:DNA helicase-2/ATP-dependent DNA helicase PcrA